MFSKFINKLRVIDIFGQQITLSFRQEDQYRTNLGGFSSLCIIGIIISFFFSNIINFFGMNTVTSKTELTFDDDPGQVKFSLDNFMFAVQIDQTNFTTNPYFNITLSQRSYTRDVNGQQVKQDPILIDLIPCTLDHFKPIFDRYNTSIETQFQQYSISNFLCPNLSDPNSNNLTIGGTYTSSIYQYLKFAVQNCENNTASSSPFSWHPKCKTQTEIDSYLGAKGSFRFQLYTIDYLINPDQAHNYIEPYIAIDQFYSFIPNSMFVQSDIKFRPKNITTDEGILMYSSENTQTFTTRDYGDYREQVGLSSVNSGSYGAFYFVRSPYSYEIQRNFMKLAELLSYLGGFAQFMVAILGIVIRFYNREHMLMELANDLYQFEVGRKKQNTETLNQLLISQQQTSRPKLSKLKDLKSDTAIQIQKVTTVLQNEINDQGEECQKINEIKQFESPQTSNLQQQNYQQQSFHLENFQKFKDLIKSKMKIGISIRFIISQILPCDIIKNDHCILFQKAIDQVYHEFDIQFIMKQLHEVIKFKKVLFNQEQQTLFNFSQKPKISLIQDKNNRQSVIIKSIQESGVEDIAQQQLFTNLVESYQKIKGLDIDQMTPEQKDLNKKLIYLLGARLPLIIEEQLEIDANQIRNNHLQDDQINN